MKKGVSFLVAVAFIAFAASFLLVSAFDPAPLQDFCIGVNDPKLGVFVNGMYCKDPSTVVADDFHYSGLNIPADTNNNVDANVTFATVNEFPALSTMGIAMARIDYGPYGINAPHYHPRAAEVLTLLEGKVMAGFVTANPDHRYFSKVLNKGDVFAFPVGLIHFQYNLGSTPAVAIATLSSQNPGVVTLANTTFGAIPPINPDILARSFHLKSEVKCPPPVTSYLSQESSDKTVEELQAFFV